MTDESGQAGALIVTPRMIEAGRSRLWECQYGEPIEDVLRVVYLAMAFEAKRSPSPLLETLTKRSETKFSNGC